MIKIEKLLVRQMPHLRMDLKKAHMREKPEEFIRNTLRLAGLIAVTVIVLGFFAFDKLEVNLAYLLPLAIVGYFLSFLFFLQSPKVQKRKREREINKEVLFAGRYILVKLEAGTPLYNAMIDASKSYGICGKYYKEIVDEIQIGTPIEDALEEAREYNASEKFKMILSELLTTLKTGADVAASLRSVLQQITNEQIIEIKAYAKKVNALILLYMVIGTVLPSLGMTMFIILAGFMSLELPGTFIVFALFMLVFLQFIFIAMFRSARPMVNL